MIRIRQVEKKQEARYRVIDVAKATGLSEGQITGYFSNRKISVKQGLTIEQVEQVLQGARRGPGIDWEKVQEIRDRLKAERGIEITEE